MLFRVQSASVCIKSALFLRFLVLRALLAVLAELQELNLALNFLLVLLGPVIHILALLAREFYQAVLGHGCKNSKIKGQNEKVRLKEYTVDTGKRQTPA